MSKAESRLRASKILRNLKKLPTPEPNLPSMLLMMSFHGFKCSVFSHADFKAVHISPSKNVWFAFVLAAPDTLPALEKCSTALDFKDKCSLMSSKVCLKKGKKSKFVLLLENQESSTFWFEMPRWGSSYHQSHCWRIAFHRVFSEAQNILGLEVEFLLFQTFYMDSIVTTFFRQQLFL